MVGKWWRILELEILLGDVQRNMGITTYIVKTNKFGIPKKWLFPLLNDVSCSTNTDLGEINGIIKKLNENFSNYMTITKTAYGPHVVPTSTISYYVLQLFVMCCNRMFASQCERILCDVMLPHTSFHTERICGHQFIICTWMMPTLCDLFCFIMTAVKSLI